jgi:predicted transporter
MTELPALAQVTLGLMALRRAKVETLPVLSEGALLLFGLVWLVVGMVFWTGLVCKLITDEERTRLAIATVLVGSVWVFGILAVFGLILRLVRRLIPG